MEVGAPKMSISLSTTCMNRNEFLEQSLQSWTYLPVDKILIVDWSSKDPVKSVVDKYQNGKVILAVVEGKEFFNRAKAVNLAHRLNRYANSKYIFSVDSDIILHPKILDRYEIDEKCFYHCHTPPIYGTFGTNIVAYENFSRVNGYNELMNGWGEEDIDFYDRLVGIGLERKFMTDLDFIHHIDHDDVKRTENYLDKNKLDSRKKNKELKLIWGAENIQEKQKCKVYLPNSEIIEDII